MTKRILRVFRMRLSECVVLILAAMVAVAIGGVVKKETIDKRRAEYDAKTKAAWQQRISAIKKRYVPTEEEKKVAAFKNKMEKIGVLVLTDINRKKAAAKKTNKRTAEVVSEGF